MGEGQTAARTPVGTPKAARLHYLDLLRAALMIIGIPYHAAWAFSGRPWGVTSPEGLPALGYFADFTHVWRMPTFFVIAGLFAALMATRRGPASWFKGRLMRLGIPLAFGLAVIGPLQLLVLAFAHRQQGETLLAAWLDEAASAATWVGHLWFLVNLLIYCALFALAVRLGLWARAEGVVQRWAQAARQSALRTFLVALGGSVLVAVAVGAWSVLHLSRLTAGVVDIDFVTYGGFFVGGLILALVPPLYTEVRSPSLPTVLIGLVTVALATGTTHVLERWDSPVSSLVNVTLVTLAGWYAAGLLFALAMRFMRGASPLVTWLVDASLTIYVFHHPLMLLISHLLIKQQVHPLVGFLTACVTVFVLSAIIYEVLSRTAVTRWISMGSGRRTSTLLDVLRRGNRASA